MVVALLRHGRLKVLRQPQNSRPPLYAPPPSAVSRRDGDSGGASTRRATAWDLLTKTPSEDREDGDEIKCLPIYIEFCPATDDEIELF